MKIKKTISLIILILSINALTACMNFDQLDDYYALTAEHPELFNEFTLEAQPIPAAAASPFVTIAQPLSGPGHQSVAGMCTEITSHPCPYICNLCSQGFANIRQLQAHENQTHLKSPDHTFFLPMKNSRIAPAREGWFSTAPLEDETDKLTKSATTAKAFMCPAPGCLSGFDQIGTLKTHLLAHHTTLRPFACSGPDCQMNFSTASNMRKHMKKYHPETSIPDVSQKTKDLIEKTLAPFLELIPKKSAPPLKRKPEKSPDYMPFAKAVIDLNSLGDHYTCSFKGCGTKSPDLKSFSAHASSHIIESIGKK